MMSVLRNTALSDKTMKEGKWEKNSLTGMELWKKKVGIVGFGRIGQIIAKRISGFEPHIMFYDPMVSTSLVNDCHKTENLETLFRDCDIITIHTPLTESTKNLIDKKYLSLMKKDAILINAARGGIVNEEDLFAMLSEKKIRGAGLDVFSQEPLTPNSPLLKLSNVTLSPHLGASTEEAQYRVGEMAVHQMKEFFISNNFLNEVK